MPIEILMPALSPTMTEGNLATWLKKEGDNVSAGDVIAEIETDKATMEVEAVDEGIIGKILVAEGSQGVAVNSAIALLLEEGEDKAVLKDYKPTQEATKPEEAKKEEPKPAAVPTSAPTPPPAPKPAAPTVATPIAAPVAAAANAGNKAPAGKIAVSPVAKRLADENKISLYNIAGTGPAGRILKADVEEFIANGGQHGIGNTVRRNPQETSEIGVDNMRQVIAARLLESKTTVPHFYLTIDCCLDGLLAARKTINDKAEGAYKISVNDFVIKAAAKALADVPEANASWAGDRIIQYSNVDISVAVAIDGGLITPIVKNADQKDLPSISGEMKDLAARAKQGALKLEEFQGGGFSISNLGMYGINNFSAIINPPQSCIMAVGSGEERVVAQNGEITLANMATITLSCDHRIVDGAVGATYLAAFKSYIENPVLLFV